MNYDSYIDQMKEIQSLLLNFFDDEITPSSEATISQFNFFDKVTAEGNKDRLIDILQLISQITNEHYRTSNFYSKVEKVLSLFTNQIKQTLSKNELFHIFSNNKIVLHYLLKQQILVIDEEISVNLMKNGNYFMYDLADFYHNESIKQIKENEKRYKEYERKQEIGENEYLLCQYIRDDTIDEFIKYINRNNIILSSKINSSSYETHPFLLENQPTIIEYAAFFGSIKIFDYLLTNNVEIDRSIWLYAIHSNNAELIYKIEDLKLDFNESFYIDCFFEAIKCHHNDIANYINNNFLIQKGINHIGNDLNEDLIHPCIEIIQFYNYQFFENEFKNKNIWIEFIMFNYSSLAKLILADPEIVIKEKYIYILKLIILMKFFIFVTNMALFVAAESGNIDIVKLLLSLNLDIDFNRLHILKLFSFLIQFQILIIYSLYYKFIFLNEILIFTNLIEF